MKDNKNSSFLPTKLSLVVRIAVGVYLLYIDYSIRDVFVKYSGKELIFYVVAMAAFGIIGIFLCIHSGRAFLTGRYIGGAMDDHSCVDHPEEE